MNVYNHIQSIYRKRSTGINLLLLCVFWFFIALPFFGTSFIPTHDGEFHIIRIYEFYNALADGNLFPRWAGGLNNDYGIPLFIFHYPLPNYIGAFFHQIGFGFIDSFKAALITGYGVAILCCYLFLAMRTKPFVALCSTLLFATVPYWFVDLSIRGSIGEIWALAFVMMALLAIQKRYVFLLGLSVAAIILSHNIMAMISIPFIAGFIWFTEKKLLSYLLLGVGISAYFWIPALYEKQYMVGLNTVTFSDHFPALQQLIIPSWGSGFSVPGIVPGEMSQQIGIVPLLIVALCCYFLRKKTNRHASILYALVWFVLSLFLMLSISIVIWRIIPPLQFIQFPWRLLSLVILTIPFLAVFVMERVSTITAIGIVCISMFLTYSYMRPVEYQPRTDEHYIYNPNFSEGTSSMGNSFSTIWTGWKETQPEKRVEVIEGTGSISHLISTTTSDVFDVYAETPLELKIHRLYYPGWNVVVDNRIIPISYESDGIIHVSVPSGSYTIESIFKETTERMTANIISICSLFVLCIISYHYYGHRV